MPKTQNNEPSFQDRKYVGIPDDLKEEIIIPPEIISSVHLPKPKEVVIDRKLFIEDNFSIRAKEEEPGGGYIVPFKLNQVQTKYYEYMMKDYPNNLDGTREIILKARQQGFSSMVLALFLVDFITKPQSVSICISHQSSATKRLFKRVRFYLESYCTKHGFPIKDYLSVDTKEELENATNGAYFYIGTAGAKVGGRGDTVTNVHFSEAAFFQETEKVDAKEIIEATVQQVPQGHGMIFIESTGGHVGSYYQAEWERAKKRESSFIPRFFSAEEFYTKEWLEAQRKYFQTEDDYKSHYPLNEMEAFLYSGRPFFDRTILGNLERGIRDPIVAGALYRDGSFMNIEHVDPEQKTAAL